MNTENLLEIKVNNIRVITIKKYGSDILFCYSKLRVQNAFDKNKFSEVLVHSTLHTSNDRFTLRPEKLTSEKGDSLQEIIKKIKQTPYSYKVNNNDSLDLYREDNPERQIKIGTKMVYVFSIALDFKNKKITDFIKNQSSSKSVYPKIKYFFLPEKQKSFAIDIYIARNNNLRIKDTNKIYTESVSIGRKKYFIEFRFKFPIDLKKAVKK